MGLVLNLSPAAPLPNASQLKAAVNSQRYPAPFPFLAGAFGSPANSDDALTTSQIYRILLHVFLSRPSMLAPQVMSLLHLKCCTTPFRSRSGHLNRPPFRLMVVVLAWYDVIGRS
jgi:hypothetical protein